MITNATDEPTRTGSDAPVEADLDTSLTASHERMTTALAMQSRRIEVSAKVGSLTVAEIDVLARLSNTWRTLVQHEP